jgi:hypothetical protein
MPAQAQERILIDHDEIRRWAEERGAIPTRVKGTGGAKDVGILRLHFPEYSEDEENLEEISWDEFFEEFDRKKLALLVEDRTANGQRSNFNKLISRATIDNFLAARRPASRPGARRLSTVSKRRAMASSSSRKRRSTGRKGRASK